jgi:hypothetical protein
MADIYLVQESAVDQANGRCSRHTDRASHSPPDHIAPHHQEDVSVFQRCTVNRAKKARLQKVRQGLGGGRAGAVTIRRSYCERSCEAVIHQRC